MKPEDALKHKWITKGIFEIPVIASSRAKAAATLKKCESLQVCNEEQVIEEFLANTGLNPSTTRKDKGTKINVGLIKKSLREEKKPVLNAKQKDSQKKGEQNLKEKLEKFKEKFNLAASKPLSNGDNTTNAKVRKNPEKRNEKKNLLAHFLARQTVSTKSGTNKNKPFGIIL